MIRRSSDNSLASARTLAGSIPAPSDKEVAKAKTKRAQTGLSLLIRFTWRMYQWNRELYKKRYDENQGLLFRSF